MTEYSLYLDDSGHPKDQPYVVVAGFVASKSQWLDFEPAWKAALARYGLGEVFHMTDFSSRNRKLSALKKEQILSSLRSVIRDHTVTAFASGVTMDAYRKVNEVYTLEESLGAPYALVGREITRQLRAWQQSFCEPDDRFLLFVEDGTLHFGDLEQIAKRDRLPNPIKVPKSLAAVQPADILGWEYFNYLRSNVISKNLMRLLRSRVATGTLFGEADLLETCRLAKIMPREYKDRFPDKFISFHSEPKRPRRRTIR
jgi:hypothetical protein